MAVDRHVHFQGGPWIVAHIHHRRVIRSHHEVPESSLPFVQLIPVITPHPGISQERGPDLIRVMPASSTEQVLLAVKPATERLNGT